MTTLSAALVSDPSLTRAASDSSPEDQDFLSRLRGQLAGQHLKALKELQVEVSELAVTLRGCVNSFYERQMALTCTRRVAGLRQIVDHIDVSVVLER